MRLWDVSRLFLNFKKTKPAMKPITLSLVLLSFSACGQPSASWEEEKIEVVRPLDQYTIISSDKLFEEGWDQLAQPNFWKQIMRLSPDSCLVNVASTRTVVAKMSNKDWEGLGDAGKQAFRDSVRTSLGLPPESSIYVTTGKNEFYQFEKVYPTLEKGITAFEKNNVDPWYAQAILLIESPGQLKKSKAGAYGPFQLMPAVARNQGLIVNSSVDERANFNRSAYGASQLIKRICIPEAKRILDQQGLAYRESDLWFRLFVLHVYHAGALNVQAVVKKINPTAGNIDLIHAMWQTTAAGFGNNSQNYTQLALAAQLVLHEMVHSQCDYILDCKPDN